MNINTVRDCFLEMMHRAEWTENVIAPYRVSHTLTVTDRDLAILADALGLDHKMTETTQSCIRRHVAVNCTEPAE
jgi:hypothetical protein